MRYFLAIERKPNDFDPIDLSLSIVKPVDAKNTTDLITIDQLTLQIEEQALKQTFFEDGLIEEEELPKNLVIIFREKEKTRKLQEGILLPGEEEALHLEYISDFILKNLSDKELMNWLYTQFNSKEISPEFRNLINGINSHETDFSIQMINSLQNLRKMSYNEIRKLGLYIKRKLEPTISVEKEVHPTLNVVIDNGRRGE